jgi:UDPglucose 6-dehydrogenase
MKIGENFGLDFSLLREVEKINQKRIERFFNHIQEALWTVKGKSLGVLGLSFKPGTDDLRESPALKIVPRLLKEGAVLKLYDPVAMDAFKEHFPESNNLSYSDSPYSAAQGAHALLIITDWQEFKDLDFGQIKDLMVTPIIIDGRNHLDPKKLYELGFEYYPMGRRPWKRTEF